MAEPQTDTQYDEVLASILINEKSILGFLSTIFNFLGRRTDFYFVPQGPTDNLGFPPGEAEKLVIKILRKCDPKNRMVDNNNTSGDDIDNAIMCSTVAQEVEICADEIDICDEEIELSTSSDNVETNRLEEEVDERTLLLPAPMKSECYNGAERENYSWSQNIMELDVIIKLPSNVESAKDLVVTINPNDISVLQKNGEVIIKDTFPHKVKASESIWTISENQLRIHLDKYEERWWKSLLSKEEQIDMSKIDCSRQLYDLPDSHIAKIQELQWNQEQKRKGLPTSDQLKNIEVLKKAWNAEGSPFKGTEFDPTVLNQ